MRFRDVKKGNVVVIDMGRVGIGYAANSVCDALAAQNVLAAIELREKQSVASLDKMSSKGSQA